MASGFLSRLFGRKKLPVELQYEDARRVLEGHQLAAKRELASREDSFELPPWVAREVSGDPRYLNTSLSVFPFRNWGTDLDNQGVSTSI